MNVHVYNSGNTISSGSIFMKKYSLFSAHGQRSYHRYLIYDHPQITSDISFARGMEYILLEIGFKKVITNVSRKNERLNIL